MKKFHIDFYGHRKIFFGVSLGIFAIGIICNLFFGTKMDINFTGGALVKYSYSGTVHAEQIEKAVQNTMNRNASVVINENVKSAEGNKVSNQVTISFAGTKSISPDEEKKLESSLVKEYPDADFQIVESNSVNPSMGRTFFLKCMVAVLIAFLLLILYVAIRFKNIGGVAAAVMAIIALLHDVLMVYFTFVIFRISLDVNFIAVVLTILGYSLNDTIVIYDRIRENRRLLGYKTPNSVLVNTSVNQNFSRTLFTSITTFTAIGIVLVMGQVFSLSSIATFAFPMMVGVVSGCYSSDCIAGPLYVMWEDYKAKKKYASKES